MPAFRAEGLRAADLARVQQTEPPQWLLNGWNEIAELNSGQADEVRREINLFELPDTRDVGWL